MKISLNEDQVLIQDMARKFAVAELASVAEKLDKVGDRHVFLKNLKTMAQFGFMGLSIDENYGGSNCGAVAFSIVITEIARACAASAVTISVTNMVAEVIQAIGTDAQKQNYIPKICSGEYSAGSFCLTEANAGSDPASMKTRAVKDGDDWVLNGTKMWISSAEYAGVFIVWAVTDPEAPKGKGISCFIVGADTPGIVIGKAEKKMGQRASATNSVTFEDCRIPDSALLGTLNHGYKIAIVELAGGRIGIGSLALGVGLAAMDYAREYTTQRKQFDRPLSSFQGLQWMMADTYTELEAARLLLMSAAYLKESGQPFMKQAAMAKLFASEAGNKACYNAVQLLGGLGYSEELPLERYARDVRVTSIYEGTSEIQRTIIARELLKDV